LVPFWLAKKVQTFELKSLKSCSSHNYDLERERERKLENFFLLLIEGKLFFDLNKTKEEKEDDVGMALHQFFGAHLI